MPLTRHIRPLLVVAVVICLSLALTAPAGWANDSPGQVIHLDAENPVATVGDITYRFIPASEDDDVTPMSASRCRGNVCIYVTGTELEVTRWRTTAGVDGPTCSSARFHRNDTIIATSSTVCSSGAGTLEATWNATRYYSHGDWLCNSWTGISGYPCIEIKA